MKKKLIDNWGFYIAIIFQLFYVLFFILEIFQLEEINHIGLFVIEGDTAGYFQPIENLINGGSLTNCRMPGFLPIYGPLYYLFGSNIAQNGIIIIQVLVHLTSIWLIGEIVKNIFKANRTANLTMFIYGISTFGLVWAFYGYADSLNHSFLIIGIYLFTKYDLNREKKIILLFSALFFGWSIFMRQASLLILLPFILFYCLKWLSEKNSVGIIFKRLFIFSIPLILSFGSWFIYNVKTYEKPIVLVEPMHNCFKSYPEHQFEMLDLAIAWGGDFTKWGGEGEWFTNAEMSKEEFPFSNNVFTSQYNLDSLEKLRQRHFLYFESNNVGEKEKIASDISKNFNEYLKSYKKEHPIDYGANKFILARKFLFPFHIDNLLLPAFDESSLFEKLIKISQLVLFNVINLLMIVGLFIAMRRKKWLLPFIVIPALIFFVFYTGWIEQRYFLVLFPFTCMLSALSINLVLNKFKFLNK